MEINSYERCAYESVDDGGLSRVKHYFGYSKVIQIPVPLFNLDIVNS